MFPEDRVLVGVINRKRDFNIARDERWYRIPQARMPHGVHAEYIAFFFSRAFKERNGGIHWYAQRRGLELVYRRDLLPGEAHHARAHEVYHKVQIGDLMAKSPPVLNPTRRPITFVYTTWDRFVHARTISDLYSRADYFVDRIYHALRSQGVAAERTWEAEYRGRPPQLRILCQQGRLTASTGDENSDFFLDARREPHAILADILVATARQGGPLRVSVPLDEIL